jgi:hypothetical protein
VTLLLGKVDVKTALGPDPQALIAEARELQLQRARRRNILLGAIGALLVAGFGIGQLARGDGVHAAGPAVASTAQAPTVIYEKAVFQKIVPDLPAETTMTETWSVSNDPLTTRQVVTIPGGRRLEIGSGPAHGKVLGREQANYLYDASTHTIYRTGYFLVPSPDLTPKQIFRRVLAEPGVRLAGTSTYLGRSVYVLKERNPVVKATAYVDKRTYEPLMNEVTGKYLRTVYRVLAHKTLPATKANLALASLPTAHQNARTVLHATPRIRELYGEAAFPSGQHG